eukprot:14450-Heterococcus_DN1.PRE.2
MRAVRIMMSLMSNCWYSSSIDITGNSAAYAFCSCRHLSAALLCNFSPLCVEDERSSLYINIRETKTVMYRCAQLLSHCKILLQAAV